MGLIARLCNRYILCVKQCRPRGHGRERAKMPPKKFKVSWLIDVTKAGVEATFDSLKLLPSRALGSSRGCTAYGHDNLGPVT